MVANASEAAIVQLKDIAADTVTMTTILVPEDALKPKGEITKVPDSMIIRHQGYVAMNPSLTQRRVYIESISNMYQTCFDLSRIDVERCRTLHNLQRSLSNLQRLLQTCMRPISI